MSGVGLELLLSTICINVTYCPAIYDNPEHDSQKTAKAQHIKYLEDQLNGKHLRIGTLERFPYSSFKRDENGTLVGTGISFVIVDILREKFNFTFDVVVPSKNYDGGASRLDDSLLGLVNNSEVDFAAAFLPVMSDSQKVVSFSPWLEEGLWAMMMKRPGESAAGSGLLAPFEQYVWYLILVAVVMYGPCITLLTRLRYRFARDDSDTPIPLSPSVWFVYGAFIKQGTTLSPEANPTRVLFATWWLFIILLSAFYTANLTAFLTLSKFTLDIEDPKDLYKKNYKWTSEQGSAVEYVVTDPDEDLYYLNKMVQQGRASFRSYTNDREFLPEVSRGIVLVEDKTAVDHLMYDDYLLKARQGVEEKNRCTYVVTPQYFMTKMRAFAYPRNNTLYNLFDPVLQSLVEAGIIKYLIHKDLPANKICPLDLQSKERRLRNSDLMMTYALAIVGLAAASAIFIGELFIRRCYTIKIKTGKNVKRREVFKGAKGIVNDSRPPPYDSLFGRGYKDTMPGKRQQINGRDYWVVKTVSGDDRLIPVRTPSAFLFQSSS